MRRWVLFRRFVVALRLHDITARCRFELPARGGLAGSRYPKLKISLSDSTSTGLLVLPEFVYGQRTSR